MATHARRFELFYAGERLVDLRRRVDRATELLSLSQLTWDDITKMRVLTDGGPTAVLDLLRAREASAVVNYRWQSRRSRYFSRWRLLYGPVRAQRLELSAEIPLRFRLGEYAEDHRKQATKIGIGKRRYSVTRWLTWVTFRPSGPVADEFSAVMHLHLTRLVVYAARSQLSFSTELYQQLERVSDDIDFEGCIQLRMLPPPRRLDARHPLPSHNIVRGVRNVRRQLEYDLQDLPGPDFRNWEFISYRRGVANTVDSGGVFLRWCRSRLCGAGRSE